MVDGSGVPAKDVQHRSCSRACLARVARLPALQIRAPADSRTGMSIALVHDRNADCAVAIAPRCGLRLPFALVAGRLRRLRADLPARLCAARRRARADPARLEPGTGADRARHAVDGRDRERRGLLLHLAARREGGRLHAAEGGRPARDRGLFRQGAPRRAARRLRPEGRQGVRLRQPHHADRRQRTVAT